jgi:hypothetical protein
MPVREVEDYLAKLLSSTPDALHPLLQKFQTYYDRKCVRYLSSPSVCLMKIYIVFSIDYGIN